MSIRTFFAVGLDADARRAAADTARELARRVPGVRWVDAEAYHVTLRFLGAIDPEQVPRLVAGVAQALSDRAPFSVRLGAPRPFPSRRRPRVVVLDLEPAQPLARLADGVEQAVVRAGLPPEPRRFHPHLTLGRVRARSRPTVPELAASGTELAVTEVVLFESQLGPEGARYLPIERIALGGSLSPDHPTKGDQHGKE